MKELTLEIVRGFMDKSYHLTYVDYNDDLDERLELFQECLRARSSDKLFEFMNDAFSEQERNSVDEAISELKEKCEEAGYSQKTIESFFDEKEDSIKDEIYSRNKSDHITDVLRRTNDIPVRVEMYSNYDCINSHWCESGSGYSYKESYFGAMVDALWLNPAKVKKLLLEHGIETRGRFPNRKYRDGKELVSYKDFLQELGNSTCGGNLLTIMAKISPLELCNKNFCFDKVTIPKGNCCGIFSHDQGGGSVLEMVLRRDVTLKIKAKKYDYFNIAVDCRSQRFGYCIEETYGVDSSVFGAHLKIAS